MELELFIAIMEKLDIPVTFIDGENTHPVIPEIISTIGDRIPDAEWVSIKGAGHMVSITHPEQVVEAGGDPDGMWRCAK